MYYRLIDSETIEIISDEKYITDKNNNENLFLLNCFGLVEFDQISKTMFMLKIINNANSKKNEYELIFNGLDPLPGLYKKHPYKKNAYIYHELFNEVLFNYIVTDIQNICRSLKWEGVSILIKNKNGIEIDNLKKMQNGSYKEEAIFSDYENYESIAFKNTLQPKLKGKDELKTEILLRSTFINSNCEYVSTEGYSCTIKKLYKISNA